MNKLDYCGNCKYFETSTGVQGICSHYESEYLGIILPATHKCDKHKTTNNLKKENT